MIPTRQTADLLLGMWALLQQLGRVPRRLIWDNEAGIGRGSRLADGVAAFTGTLATTAACSCKPYDPESKGIVERRNGFFETSFMPGRDFTSPADFNAQFADWLDQRERPGGAHDQGPPGRSARRRPGRDAAVAAGPAARSGWVNRVRLGRDYYVRVDASDYSVDPAAIGRLVDVTADLDRVEVRLDGRLVADHARVWARGMTITDPAHVATAKRAARAVPAAPTGADPHDDLVRDLADYDRAFGLVDATGRSA